MQEDLLSKAELRAAEGAAQAKLKIQSLERQLVRFQKTHIHTLRSFS